MEASEKVQKKFTRMLPELEDIIFKESLDNLFSLEHRRLWQDLAEIYKIMRHSYDKLSRTFFPGGNDKDRIKTNKVA